MTAMTNWNWIKFGVSFFADFFNGFYLQKPYYLGVWTLLTTGTTYFDLVGQFSREWYTGSIEGEFLRIIR